MWYGFIMKLIINPNPPIRFEYSHSLFNSFDLGSESDDDDGDDNKKPDWR